MPTEETTNLAGSVIINNTSYSGADIRVSVVIPDARDAITRQLEQIQEDIRKTQEELDEVNSALSLTYSKIPTYKEGTPEIGLTHTRVTRLLYNKNVLLNTLESLQDRQRTLFVEPRATTKVLAECQTVSLSTYRDKREVRSFGSVYPKGYTRGPRTVAGTMVFTVFNESVLYEFLEAHPSDFDAHQGMMAAVLDQLPPMDILLSFANEYGAVSRMAIHAVEFVSEGLVMSIEDILTENTVQYVGRVYDPMRSVSKKKYDENQRLVSTNISGKRASDLILEEDYQRLKDQLSPFGRRRNILNPFV